MNLKSKFFGLISAGSIVLSSVVSLLSFSADSSLTAEIIQKTRYQEQFTSNSDNKSAYSQNCEKLSLKDVGYIYNWYSDTLGQVNDILQNSGTVPSVYNLPSRTYELNSAKAFVEYPNSKSETITLSWFLCSGPSGYSENFSEIKMSGYEIKPNSILVERAFSDGSKRAFLLLPVSNSLDVYIYNSSGYRFNSSQDFNVLGDSDGSLISPFKFSSTTYCTVNNSGKNTCRYNLYTYDYTNYDYRLIDSSNNILDYPTDEQIIKGDIRINYKNKTAASWSFSNYNRRSIGTFYMSCFYNNRNEREITNQQFYSISYNYPGMTIYNISSPNYNNTNFFDSPYLTFNNDTNQYSLDFDSLLDDLKLQLPDVDTYLKPTFDFQPSVDGNFQMPLDFNYNDLFDDILFNPPDVPGGGGGGGTITPWQPPEFPEHTTSFIISAPVTTFTTDYLNADVDEEIIDMSKEIVTYGYNIWVGAGLISVVIFLTGFALVWRFTGGEN